MNTDATKPIKYIMYCRKSSEGDDRQAASLPAQKRELIDLQEKENLKVIKVIEEAQSAYHKGRPQFSQMINDVRTGKANGILVWSLNRVTRNTNDHNLIVELMNDGCLRRITTPNKSYNNNADDIVAMEMDFINSKWYSAKLSEVVRRGNRQKFLVKKEWSGLAKPGYKNEFDQQLRKNILVVDEERFQLLRKAALLIINGTHTAGQALHTLNEKWGFKTRYIKVNGGKKFSRTSFYAFLSDTYYYGLMKRKFDGRDYTVMGEHKPMFTEEEFDLLQIRLGKKGLPHQSKHDFPYKSALKCGGCGGSVTAQEKWQVICPDCKLKFHKGRLTNSCPQCSIKIEDMIKPKVLHYIYYGCVKKVHPECTEKHIRVENIEKTIDEELKKFEIPKEFTLWAIKYLQEVNTVTENDQSERLKYLHKQQVACLAQIQNLVNLKTRSDNVDGSILSDDEFVAQKKKLNTEAESITSQIKHADTQVNNWVYLTEETFKFACFARYWFTKGDIKTKTYILSKLGNNLLIKDGKLLVDQSKAFFLIQSGYDSVKSLANKLEPNLEVITPTQMLSLEPVCKLWRRRQDSNLRGIAPARFPSACRSRWATPPRKFIIPSLALITVL